MILIIKCNIEGTMKTNAYNILNKVDSRLFKAFLAAADCQNFTLAAKEAGMTQSGVSQQVSKLEDQLGVVLFKRINKSVQLNENGKVLKNYIQKYLNEMDELLIGFNNSDSILSGKVSYSMPNSCLLSPHLGMLLKKIKNHKNINLDISINRSEKVYEKIISGKVDFGFVTNKVENPAIQHTFFCEEEICLVGGKEFKNFSFQDKNITKERFVTFDGIDDYLKPWFTTHWRRKRVPNSSELNAAGSITHLHGVMTLIENNVGLSILPRHSVESKIKDKKIFVIGPSKKTIKNKIYIATLKGNHLPKKVEKIISSFISLI